MQGGYFACLERELPSLAVKPSPHPEEEERGVSRWAFRRKIERKNSTWLGRGRERYAILAKYQTVRVQQ